MNIKHIHVTKNTKEISTWGTHLKGFCIAYTQDGEKVRWGVSVCPLEKKAYNRTIWRENATKALENMEPGYSGEFLIREAVAYGMFREIECSKFYSHLMTPELMMTIWNNIPENFAFTNEMIRFFVFQQCVYNTESRHIKLEMGV